MATKRRIMIAVGVIAILSGCSVNQTLYDQAVDYHDTVVVDVLLPRYVTHPDTTPAEAENITAAVDEHEAFLELVGEDMR